MKHGLQKFKADTRAGQAFKGVVTVLPFRIENRNCVRNLFSYRVMITNDEIDSMLLCKLCFINGGNSAITGNDEGSIYLNSVSDCIGSNLIPLLKEVWYVLVDVQSNLF